MDEYIPEEAVKEATRPLSNENFGLQDVVSSEEVRGYLEDVAVSHPLAGQFHMNGVGLQIYRDDLVKVGNIISQVFKEFYGMDKFFFREVLDEIAGRVADEFSKGRTDLSILDSCMCYARGLLMRESVRGVPVEQINVDGTPSQQLDFFEEDASEVSPYIVSEALEEARGVHEDTQIPERWVKEAFEIFTYNHPLMRRDSWSADVEEGFQEDQHVLARSLREYSKLEDYLESTGQARLDVQDVARLSLERGPAYVHNTLVLSGTVSEWRQILQEFPHRNALEVYGKRRKKAIENFGRAAARVEDEGVGPHTKSILEEILEDAIGDVDLWNGLPERAKREMFSFAGRD